MAATTSYETTCPNCGEDFDVRASDAEANCPRCKAHLVFRDLDKERREREKAKAQELKEKEAARKRAAEQKARAAERAKEIALAKALEREEAKRRAAEQKAKDAERAKKAAELQAAQKLKDAEAKAAQKAKDAKKRAKAKAEAEAAKRQEAQERAKANAAAAAAKHKAAKARDAAKRDAIKAEAEAAKSARDRFMTRPDRSSGDKGGIPIIDIEGIGPTFEKKLKALGIHTTDDLLAADEKKLVEKTGILQKKIRAWQDMCDLIHLPGIGPQYAEILVRSDVNSVKELSLEKADELNKKVKATMKRVNVTIQGAGMGPKRAQGWIDAARAVYPLEEDPGEKAHHDALVGSGPAKLPRAPKGGKGGKSLEQLEKEKSTAEKAKLKAQAAEKKEKLAEDQKRTKAKAKAEKAKAKLQAKQDKQDHKAAKKLAISMGIDLPVALQLIQAGVRSVDDLASQDATALAKKVKEAKA